MKSEYNKGNVNLERSNGSFWKISIYDENTAKLYIQEKDLEDLSSLLNKVLENKCDREYCSKPIS